MIFSEFEESELFCRFFRLRSPNNDKPVRVAPPIGLIAELGDLDSSRGGGVSQVAQFPFNRSVQFSHEDKSGMMRLNPFNELMIVEPFIGADQNGSGPFGDLGGTGGQKIRHAGGGMGITGPEFSMPEVFGDSLETEKRVVGRSTPLHGIVTDPGSFLFSVDGQDRRVDVEDKARGNVGTCCHAEQKSVVQCSEFEQCGGSQSQKETPEGRRVWIGREACQILKDAVVPQQLCGFETFDPQHHGIQDGKKHLADAVVVVPLFPGDIFGNGGLETDAAQETVQQVDSPIVGQGAFAERNGQIARTSRHGNESYFLSSFHSRPQISGQARKNKAPIAA